MFVGSITIRVTVFGKESHDEELWEMRRNPNETVFIYRWKIDRIEGEKSDLIKEYSAVPMEENEFTSDFLKGFIQGMD